MAKIFHKIKKGLNLEPQAAAPLLPDEGDLYYNTTEGLQLRTSAGWVSPGSGSGSGELNFVDNPSDANQNWFASAGTGDVSVATSNNDAENPLEGIIRTSIKFTSTTSGTKYIYTRFKVPDTLLTSKEKFEWYMKTLSGFVAGQWTVELWWNTQSDYLGTYTEFPLRNDVAGVSAIPALTGRYYNQWNGLQAAQYLELRIARPTGAGLATWTATNVIAGPGVNSIDQSDQSPAMAGSIIPYSGPLTGFQSIGSDGTTLQVKNGWALCNGASISQSLYSQLFANQGTTWDLGARQDGTGGNYSAPSAGFFRLPDLRGVFLRGVGTSSRIDGTGDVVKTLAQFNNDTTIPNGLTVGSTTTVNNTDLSHTHDLNSHTHGPGTYATSLSGTFGAAGHSHALDTPSSGAAIDISTTGIYNRRGAATYTADRVIGGLSAAGTSISDTVTALVGSSAAPSSTASLSGSNSVTGASGPSTGSTAGASVTMNHAHTASTTSTPTSTDLETAPRNTGVNYLVKLYDAQSLNVLNSTATSPFKAGFITAGAMGTAPQGWLECGGQAVSRAIYTELFSAIGTTYGAGDGSTTFNLPDLRGRVIAGKDDLGGTLASRITNAIAGFIGTTLGAAGGNQALHAHTHTVSGSTTASSTGGGTTGAADANHTHTFSGTTGSQNANHNHGYAGQAVTIGPGAGALVINASGIDYGDRTLGESQAHQHAYSGTTSGMSTSHAHPVPALSIPSLSVSGTAASTGAGASQNVQPTLILNYFIKAFNDTIDVTGFNVAGPNTTGLVTNSAQTFGGVKSFPDGIITPSISTGAPNTFTTTGTATGGLNIANSATPITLNLSTAVGQDGKQMTIKNINVGVVTVDPSGAETIDGLATRPLNQYDSLTIVAYAGQWYII